MVSIIQGTTNKPVSSQRLADFFARRPGYAGLVYIGYPGCGERGCKMSLNRPMESPGSTYWRCVYGRI